MAQAGDVFEVELKECHLDWGNETRHTMSRASRSGEGYIPIPSCDSRRIGIYNSNNSNQGLGYNQFNVTSADNFFNNETNDIMLAQGCSEAGSQYAKQFSIQNNLQRLGEWYQYTNARPGDIVRVSWLNSTDITLELIHN